MYCDFVIKLRALKKSSAESVDNALVENKFKEYMHVTRSVENELREAIKEINHNQNKCLLLLCGSSGDGKSHILSYLKYADEEKLLDDFVLHNDATESEAPNMTAIDTLASVLDEFSDEKLDNGEDKKLIVAINIGTLMKFISSSQGEKFQKLAAYVEERGITTGQNRTTGYRDNSIFQHVSFSDYQVFTLKEKGVGTDYLETLFGKIFSTDESNPFYSSYLSNNSCSMASRCPVRMNYELMLNPEIQKSVISRIIEVVIKDKAIVSTRDVLNAVYEILVHPDFDYTSLCGVVSSDIQYLSKCIPWTTPMLLNEFEDVSPLMDCIREHDILKVRQEDMDNAAIAFHSMENIKEVFDSLTVGTSYEILSSITDVSILGGIKPELKKVVYRFLVRLKEMNCISDNNQSSRLQEFLKYIYYDTCGMESELAKLYEMTKHAILCWEGFFSDGDICIDSSNDMYWLVEQIALQPCIYGKEVVNEVDLKRFSPNIKLRFENSANVSAGSAEIVMDYALFELISNMEKGYRPTVQDKNHHADFDSFVRKVTELGNKKTRVMIVSRNNDNEKYVFEKDPFGKYTFKVV